MPLRDVVLPVEELVFDSPLLRMGTFRCGPEDGLFEDSGPIVNHIFVFPRTSVVIEHEGAHPFVATPALATLYNAGQRYTRRPVSAEGDHCDWFALAPEIVVEAVAESHPPARDREEQPFSSPWAACPAPLYLRQRRAFRRAKLQQVDGLHLEEEAIEILRALMRANPAMIRGMRYPRQSVERVEEAKRAIVADPTAQISLSSLARSTGTSPYHLCRIFREVTGLSLRAYRHEVRLRMGLARLEQAGDLLQLALDLGYSSHAHFSDRFRRTFGVTPSRYRAGAG